MFQGALNAADRKRAHLLATLTFSGDSIVESSVEFGTFFHVFERNANSTAIVDTVVGYQYVADENKCDGAVDVAVTNGATGFTTTVDDTSACPAIARYAGGTYDITPVCEEAPKCDRGDASVEEPAVEETPQFRRPLKKAHKTIVGVLQQQSEEIGRAHV